MSDLVFAIFLVAKYPIIDYTVLSELHFVYFRWLFISLTYQPITGKLVEQFATLRLI